MRDLLIAPAGSMGARPVMVAVASRRDRYRRWVAATTLGELVGFTVPAVVGAAVTAAGLRQPFTVAANALGWVAGLVVVFTAIGLAPSSPAAVAVAGVLGGLGMGLVVALVTGAFLVRLLDRRGPAGT